MALYYDEICDLAKLLKHNGDKVLDSSCKLSLSSSLISKLNASISYFYKHKDPNLPTDTAESVPKGGLELQFLYDFIQKTVALKVLPDFEVVEPYCIDLHLFSNLRLLEINRLSLGLVKGLKFLRSHLEYVTCIRSLTNLNDILESCGGDRTQGYIWDCLKKAVFSYNCLSALDASLEFVPKLEVLDLSHNSLTDAHMINCLLSLNNLNLSYNKLEVVPSFHGNLCNNLRRLSLHSNFIEDIKGLSPLVNLQELDLSNNCLLSHCKLAPLSCLPNLEWLNLLGNPLSFHPYHRTFSILHLHPRITGNFVLDFIKLNKDEKRNLNSSHNSESTISRSDSSCSVVTSSTVISKHHNINSKKPYSIDISSSQSVSLSLASTNIIEDNSSSNTTSDTDDNATVITKSMNITLEETNCPEVSSLHSVSIVSASMDDDSNSNNSADIVNNDATSVDEVVNTLADDNIQMQDSGFFAGTRPISPSQSSIGSASSLYSNEIHLPVTRYESDIEVITNPSQSSIEVLDQDSRDIRFSPS